MAAPIKKRSPCSFVLGKQVHLSCCWGIPSLVLEPILGGGGFWWRSKTSWDLQPHGWNNYQILDLSVRRQWLARAQSIIHFKKFLYISTFSFSHVGPWLRQLSIKYRVVVISSWLDMTSIILHQRSYDGNSHELLIGLTHQHTSWREKDGHGVYKAQESAQEQEAPPIQEL